MFNGEQFQGIGMTSKRTHLRLLERLSEQGITDPDVLSAISEIPRHMFIEEGMAHRAYENDALPIGLGQTISQPYIVGIMTQTLWQTTKHNKLLEIGTGSGYQTAILSRLWQQVHTVERIRPLHQIAKNRLISMGLRNIDYKAADGFNGWIEKAPYDAIIVTAAAPKVPEKLFHQLDEGGVMVIPLGKEDSIQELVAVTNENNQMNLRTLEKVRFVPMLPGIQT